MESLSIADFSVELETPACELKWEGCTGDAAAAFRVHGCAFYYTCQNCRDIILKRIKCNFLRFRQMKCSSCGMEFTQGSYFNMTNL